MLSLVYYIHLNQDDLNSIIAFYTTPIGKKFAQKTPFITQESMLIGQAWGKKIGEALVKKMTEYGY